MIAIANVEWFIACVLKRVRTSVTAPVVQAIVPIDTIKTN